MGGIDLFVCAQDTGVFFSVFLSVPGWKKGGRHTWQGVLRGRSPPPVRACGLQRRCGLCANPLEETALAAPVEYCGGRGGGGVLLNARLLRALRASPVGQPASHRWRAPRPNVSQKISCSTCCPLPRSSPSLSASVSASHPPFRHGTQTPPPPFIRSQERAASGKCCDGPTRGMPREGSGASGFKKKKKRYAGPCAVRGEDHRTQAVE